MMGIGPLLVGLSVCSGRTLYSHTSLIFLNRDQFWVCAFGVVVVLGLIAYKRLVVSRRKPNEVVERSRHRSRVISLQRPARKTPVTVRFHCCPFRILTLFEVVEE
jgi:hypothetical protein